MNAYKAWIAGEPKTFVEVEGENEIEARKAAESKLELCRKGYNGPIVCQNKESGNTYLVLRNGASYKH